MPKQSKNSKNQKKVDNEPDPKPITSKFFVQDDEDDEQIEEQPIEPEENTKQIEPAIVQQKPIKSKFFVEEDDEEDIQTEPTPVQPIENTPITSKFFSNNDENEEAPKISKKSKKKGKKVDETPKIEEKKTEEIIIKDSSISKPNSKFFQAEEDEEEEPVQLIKEDLPEEKDEKKDKKKEKRKAKKEAQKEKKDEPKKEIVDKKPKKLTGAAKQALELMNKLKEEEDRIKKEEEERQRIEEEIRLKEEEEERVRKELDEKKKMDKKNKIMQGKIDGTYMTKKQREKMNEDLIKRKQLEEMGFLNTFDKTEEEKKSEPKKKFFKKKTELQELEEKLRLKELEKNQTSSINPNEKIQNSDETQIVEDWSQLISDNKETLASVNNPLTSPSKKPKDSQKNPDPSSQEEYKLAETQIQPKPQPQTQLKKETNPNPISKNPKNLQELRSPICCILGHVDTGKTTILDRIRNTNVQEGEAGGITQQIGATFFPASKLEEEIKKLKSFYEIDCNVPGILIIDTPGHESFSNLRSRGSSLCDIAILVIDLMHGIEKQTLESLELLKMRKTPFIVALNKIDRIYEWKPYKNESGYLSLKKQKSSSSGEFKKRLDGVITELAANGFNSALFWENPDVGSYISLVPTSGITGEGLPDLLGVILKYSSKFLRQKIKMLGDVFDCTVLEVKMIEGLGTTIDVILVNGELSEGDKIVLMGFNGPIVTTIRALLTPHPMKEMRVKNEYMHHKKIHASMGVKISACDFENAVAGSHLYVARSDEDIEEFTRELQADFEGVRKRIELVNQGVCVAASTLGSLEALLQFLKTSKIPVAHIGVGPVSKEDVTKSLKAILADDDKKKKKEFATVLAFDVKILPEAQQFADQNGIKIFSANIIYHLFDQFMAYVTEIREERKKEEGKDAVFPCILKCVAFINKKDPLILGVDVYKGILKVGTPICLYDNTKMKIGTVESIELNKKSLKEAIPANGSVAIRLKADPTMTAGRHFELNAKFVSILSRQSLDLLKEYFKDEMTKPNWDLVRDLKPFFQIY